MVKRCLLPLFLAGPLFLASVASAGYYDDLGKTYAIQNRKYTMKHEIAPMIGFLPLDAFEKSRSRIRSIALVHEKLYLSQDIANIDFHQYIRGLVNYIAQTIGTSDREVIVDIRTDEGICLDIDTAVPMGLILNELITNAYQHAFPPKIDGNVVIEFRGEPEKGYLLEVGDDGRGFQPEMKDGGFATLGLQLVDMLVRQLNGTLDLETSRGSRFTIGLPPRTTDN